MLSITTSQATLYALRLETSETFESFSKKFSIFGGRATELEVSRIILDAGFYVTFFGGIGMIVDPRKYASIVAAGVIGLGIGSVLLYSAARRIQGLWELEILTEIINERGWGNYPVWMKDKYWERTR
ncbi:MAG TPA: hypothetical protein VGO47_04340 [Chlamydiales bacterium]|jgi:hypothetical protein|nr:hypothetical protein [Chlamydiales bacterium]